jgi:Family of unknown function (DUF5343)
VPVTQDKPAPYAPSTATMNIVERFRERGIPAPINGDALLRTGLVTESLMPRTLYALHALDLIDDAGNPTDTLKAIQRAPAAEYQACLADWIGAAYADVLNFIDPATASEQDVHDAFRLYNPPGQRARMVTLFLGLARAAGLASEKPSGSGTGAPRKPSTTGQVRVRTRVRQDAKPPGDQMGDNKAGKPKDNGAGDQRNQNPPEDFRAALLAKFPTFDPNWPDEIKAKWFDGFATFTKELGPK